MICDHSNFMELQASWPVCEDLEGTHPQPQHRLPPCLVLCQWSGLALIERETIHTTMFRTSFASYGLVSSRVCNQWDGLARELCPTGHGLWVFMGQY